MKPEGWRWIPASGRIDVRPGTNRRSIARPAVRIEQEGNIVNSRPVTCVPFGYGFVMHRAARARILF
jgi:hypothetical protein